MSEPIKNPAWFLPVLAFLAPVAIGALGYYRGRQEGSGTLAEERRLREEINRQGGVLDIRNQPVFPSPSAPRTAQEMVTWTPEQMLARTRAAAGEYKTTYVPIIGATPLPDDGGMLSEYTDLEVMLMAGVVVVGGILLVRSI